jgi:Abortive infection alpha
MDAHELIKHAPVIAEATTAVAAAIPFTGIAKRMLGPAADEVAEMWRDRVRLYRYGRQLDCLKKAEQMAKDAGFTPKAVPIKLLFPLLEGASLEENEDLHTMWAALLANAASPTKAEQVRPGFVAILKQMAPDEAALLKLIAGFTAEFNSYLKNTHASSKETLDRMIRAYNEEKMSGLRASFKKRHEQAAEADLRLETCTQLLSNVGLIRFLDEITLLSALGEALLEVCEPPTSER